MSVKKLVTTSEQPKPKFWPKPLPKLIISVF